MLPQILCEEASSNSPKPRRRRTFEIIRKGDDEEDDAVLSRKKKIINVDEKPAFYAVDYIISVRPLVQNGVKVDVALDIFLHLSRLDFGPSSLPPSPRTDADA